jgi:hypothetical protein
MKKLLLIILILFFPVLVRAGGVMIVGGGTPVIAGHTDYTADVNCQGAWLFTDLTDSSGKGNTLTNVGTTTFSNADLPTGYTTGQAAVLNGTTQTLIRADADLTTNFPGKKATCPDWALAFWFKPDAVATDAEMVSKANNGWYTNLTWRTGAVYDALYFKQYDTGWTSHNEPIEPTGKIDAGVWYHLVLSIDGAATSVVTVWLSSTVFGNQINGTAFNLDDVDNLLADGATPFRICGDGDTIWFDGQIYQPIVFDRTLNATEVQEIYTYGIMGIN